MLVRTSESAYSGTVYRRYIARMREFQWGFSLFRNPNRRKRLFGKIHRPVNFVGGYQMTAYIATFLRAEVNSFQGSHPRAQNRLLITHIRLIIENNIYAECRNRSATEVIRTIEAFLPLLPLPFTPE